jgi:hypothetical protein
MNLSAKNISLESSNHSVVNLRLLYISSELVIPAKAGIQPRNTGFRVKPGMTNIRKEISESLH